MVLDMFIKCIVTVSKLIKMEVDMPINLKFHYSLVQ
jgi:hypothetical protein